MNKLIYLFFIVFIAFLSCDGRDRVHKTNEEVLIEHKLLDSFSERVTYFPETYTEVETDTILSNGYRVNIKLYSDMENAILVEKQQDKIISKTYYRKLIADVEIYSSSTAVFKDTINTDFLVKKGILSESESNSYLAHGFWIETYNDVHNGVPILFFNYVNAESNEKRLFKFIFYKNECLIEEIA